MTCSCFCHDYVFTSNKVLSPYEHCPGCSEWHAPPTEPVWADWKTVMSLVVEEIVYQDEPFQPIRYTWRVRLEGDSPMSDHMIHAAVSQQHMQDDYLGAEEQAHRLLAKEVNAHWKKHGQSAWARQAMMAAHATTVVGKLKASKWLTDGAPASIWKVKEAVSGHTVVGDLKKWLPGLEAKVRCPAKGMLSCNLCTQYGMLCTHDKSTLPCEVRGSVREMIVHLNDGHRWDRNAVADWLETLDVDLSFGAEPPVELPKAKRGEKLVIIGHTLRAAEQEAKRRNRGPREVELASSQQGNMRVVELLRGHRDFQYVVLPGTYLAPEVLDLLEWAEAVEVGEEERNKDVEAIEKMEYMYQQYLLKKTTPAPIHPAYYKEIMQLAGYLDKEVLAGEPVQAKKVGETVEFKFFKAADWSESKLFHEPVHKSGLPCKGPDCGICKLIAVNEKHVQPKTLKQQALDAKKNSAHTHFTVNPTKKSPFKK